MNKRIEFEIRLDINRFRRGLMDNLDFEFGLKMRGRQLLESTIK